MRLFAGLALGCGDIDRDTQVNLTISGMASGGPGFAVDTQVGHQLIEVAQPGCDKDRHAGLAGLLEGVRAVHGDPKLRVGRLIRFRHQANVVEVIELAVEREVLLGPGALQDL